jgi:hypothetical protein
MPLLARKRVLLARIETTYGTDPNPTGAADAILVRNMSVTPQEADLVDRDLVRPYIGRSEQLPAGIRAMVDFEVEIAGVATAGQAPGWGSLMRACAFSQTLTAAAVVGTAQAGSTATTIVLATGASAVDGFYNGMPVRITTGTGNDQSRIIIGYAGSTRTATVATSWTTNPDATSQYSIDPNAVYRPVSGSFESVTIYFNVDGVLHRLTGCRGSVQATLTVKQIPVLKFSFTGIYNAVTDTAAPAPTYTAFQTPVPVTNTNTTAFRLHGTAAVLSELSIDAQVSTIHRTLVNGAESVLVTDREPQGQVTIEAETVAFRNWWTLTQNATLGAMQIIHGTATSGQRVVLSSPRVQLTKPAYNEQDGIQMLQMGLQFVPSTVGNDELAIAVY